MDTRILTFSFFLAITANVEGQVLQFNVIDEQVAVGATELAVDPKIRATYDDWGDNTTFYSPSIVDTGSQYALWVHTGWVGAGCPDAQSGRDNVIVFKSSAIEGPYLPRGYQGGDITRSEMRASLVTDSFANNECVPGYYWGVGDVIPFSGQFLATFDVSTDPTLGDSAKFSFYLSGSDGLDRTSSMYKFADSSTTTPQKIMVEPVPFSLANDTVGVLFEFANTDFTNTSLGYMYIEFNEFPSSYSVHVLGIDGLYHQLTGPDYFITFDLQDVREDTGIKSINRIIEIDGGWTAFYQHVVPGTDAGFCSEVDKSAQLRYRQFVVAGNEWVGWAQSGHAIRDGDFNIVVRDGPTGVGYPSPLLVVPDSGYLFFTKDNECGGTFAGLDIMKGTFGVLDPSVIFIDGLESGDPSGWD